MHPRLRMTVQDGLDYLAGGMSVDERLHHLMAAEPGVKVHLYGKQVRPGRKIGHVTALGEDMADCRRRAARAAHWIQFGEPL